MEVDLRCRILAFRGAGGKPPRREGKPIGSYPTILCEDSQKFKT